MFKKVLLAGAAKALISLAMIPVAAASSVCTVEIATDKVVLDEVRRGGRSAEATLPLIDELQRLSEKGAIPNKPLVDQLSTRDAARFASLSSQLAATQLTDLIEGAYERDAKVVARMWQTAWQIYTDRSWVPADNNLEAQLLLVMRTAFPNPEFTSPEGSAAQCSVDKALADAASESLKRLNSFSAVLAPNLKLVESLRTKYRLAKGDRFDRSKMDPQDVRRLDQVLVAVEPAQREGALSQDLQNIRDWWAAAILVHETRQADIRTYGSDPHSIGKTLDSMAESFDERKRGMILLWRNVNEKIESRWIKDAKGLSLNN